MATKVKDNIKNKDADLSKIVAELQQQNQQLLEENKKLKDELAELKKETINTSISKLDVTEQKQEQTKESSSISSDQPKPKKKKKTKKKQSSIETKQETKSVAEKVKEEAKSEEKKGKQEENKQETKDEQEDNGFQSLKKKVRKEKKPEPEVDSITKMRRAAYEAVRQKTKRYYSNDPFVVLDAKEKAKIMREKLGYNPRDYKNAVQIKLPPLPRPPDLPKPPTSLKPSTITRIMRDYKEIVSEKSTHISAIMMTNNILLWHCNLRPSQGPYAGVTFHCQLYLEDYPLNPPQLFLFTPMPHPNVYQGYICLDMLQRSYLPYSGWSSSYSIQGVLFQLLAFLTAETIDQSSGTAEAQINQVEYVDAAKDQIDSFKCQLCGHSYEKPFPPLVDPIRDFSLGKNELPSDYLSPPRRDPNNFLNASDCSSYVTISEDGLSITCDLQKGWWGARSVKSYQIGGKFNKSCYFEVQIAGRGVSRVGFSLRGARYNLGTDFKGWGFGGTAKKSHGNEFTDYGMGYRKGDIIGCALDLVSGELVYFRNGRCLGVAFTIPASFHGKNLYPTVSMRNMELRLNFGAKGFRYFPIQFKSMYGEAKPAPVLDVFKSLEGMEETADNPPKLLVPPKPNPSKEPWVPIDGVDRFSKIGKDLLGYIFSSLSQRSLWNINRTCKLFRQVIKEQLIMEKLELFCFHSKKTYKECTLGIGISYDTKLNTYSTTLDLLSYESYLYDNVRQSVWNIRFQYFLPLVIGTGYMKNKRDLLNVLKRSLVSIALNKPNTSLFDFTPIMGLNVLCRLMDNTVNDLCNQTVTEAFSYLSEKAIVGYCAFHHMLIFFTSIHPEISKLADEKLKYFTEAPEKSPPLGELLVCLGISKDYQWSSLRKLFIAELFRRSKTEIAQLPRKNLDVDSLFTFVMDIMTKPVRNLMFHIYFLDKIAKPKGETLTSLLEKYNVSFGRPSFKQLADVSAFCKELVGINKWSHFAQIIHCEDIGTKEVLDLLPNSNTIGK